VLNLPYIAINHVHVMHFIMSFHILCIRHTYIVHMHAIGVLEGVTLLEFKQGPLEEQQQVQELKVQP
jgi:hypothetical protein